MPFSEVTAHRATLEEAYMELTRDAVEFRAGRCAVMATITPYRSGQRPGPDGFAQLVRAEWTKFRTVRGWVIGLIVAVAGDGRVGLLTAGASGTCASGRPAARRTAGRPCSPRSRSAPAASR